MSDEEKSRLIDHFSNYRLYGLILFFVPMTFIYNNLLYVSFYVGIFFIIMILIALYKMHKITLPAEFMRRYYLSRAIVLFGVLLYFILFWIKYGK